MTPNVSTGFQISQTQFPEFPPAYVTNGNKSTMTCHSWCNILTSVSRILLKSSLTINYYLSSESIFVVI